MKQNFFKKILLRIPIYLLIVAAISLFPFWRAIRPPKIVSPTTPASYRLPSEDVTLITPDALKLAAWLISNTRNHIRNRAIILVHGYPGEKVDMLGFAAFLHSDFDLLLLDLRYFGKSEGNYTTFGIQERMDLKSAADFLESRGYEQIGVLGFSLGGAIALLTTAEDKRINAVASYAAFSDLETLGLETYSRLWILKKPMVSAMQLWARTLFGESVVTISPINAARRIDVPVLIIHSREDRQIPVRHGERLKEVLKKNSRAEFHFPAGGFHREVPPDFNQRVRHFFLKAFGVAKEGKAGPS